MIVRRSHAWWDESCRVRGGVCLQKVLWVILNESYFWHVLSTAVVVFQQMLHSWSLAWLIGCTLPRFRLPLPWRLQNVWQRAAERCNECGLREQPAKPRMEKQRVCAQPRRGRGRALAVVWRSSRPTIMQRQKCDSWQDTRSPRTKMCALLTQATRARLAASTLSHQPLPWKHAILVSSPAKRIMVREREKNRLRKNMAQSSKTRSPKCTSARWPSPRMLLYFFHFLY